MKLDDGSHLNVMDDSDLTDFIHHHAWFEGDEVAPPREDRVYLLGNFTGQTPEKRRVTQSRSDLKDLNVACSFSVETEQHELDPDGNGADEMVTDEMLPDDENGGDCETSVQKPLTSNQKKVIQNIHDNCGHPSKEEFLRALRLSRAPQEVLDCVRREFECPACAAKGHPPKLGFLAALPRTFRFNETLGVVFFFRLSLRMVPKAFSATWCVGARCTNCAFLSWTRLPGRWRSALLNDGSSTLVLPC